MMQYSGPSWLSSRHHVKASSEVRTVGTTGQESGFGQVGSDDFGLGAELPHAFYHSVVHAGIELPVVAQDGVDQYEVVRGFKVVEKTFHNLHLPIGGQITGIEGVKV